MFAVNTSQKVIGFGPIAVLPGSMAELPYPYTAEHPTVKYYISKGWITVSGSNIPVAAIPVNPPSVVTEEPAISFDQLEGMATALGIDLVPGEDIVHLFKRINAAIQPKADEDTVSDADNDGYTPPSEEGNDDETEGDGEGSTLTEGLTTRAVTRMNLADLQKTARALSIDFNESDGRAALIEQINKALFSENEGINE